MSGFKLHNEQALFRQAAEGNEPAFRTIFEHFTPKLNFFLLNIVKSPQVAEEMVQEVFLKFWKQKDAVALMDNPGGWLYTVSANLAFNYLKRAATEEKVISQLKRLIQDSQNNTEDVVISREGEATLRQAIQELPAQRQLIYKLSRQDGLTHQQIADHLNISPNTVKNQLVSALHFIREYLRRAGTFLFSLLLTLLSISRF